MTTSSAQTAVSREGARTVVWLNGEHDIATSVALADTLAGAISLDDADLVVDLSGVTFMAGATISELVRSEHALRGQHRRLAVRAPSGIAARVLELCGLTDLVECAGPAGGLRQTRQRLPVAFPVA
jgi:anti-anti-sigma factor